MKDHVRKVSHALSQTAFRDGRRLKHLINDSAQLIIDLFQQLHAAILVLWQTFLAVARHSYGAAPWAASACCFR